MKTKTRVTSDRLKDSPCKLLFTSVYEKGEFNMILRVTYSFFLYTHLILFINCMLEKCVEAAKSLALEDE